MTDFELAERVAERTAERVGELFDEKLKALSEDLTEKIGRVKDELGAKILELDKRPQIVGTSDRQPRVLVVDDHTNLAHALVRHLEAAGMSASPSVTVEDALKFLADDFSLEVAVVDVKMPKNGYTLLEHIREHHPNIEVIVASGRAEPEHAMAHGAFGFLEKPFNIPLAILTITRAAEHRRAKIAARIF